jgi:Tol biopolymer transport system component
VIVWFLALSFAFLVSSDLTGVAASSAEPLGAVPSCGEDRIQLVGTTRTGDPTDLNEFPVLRPAVLPSNLEVASVFRPFLDKMWQASPTFRGQWRRLAAGTGVRVSVLVEILPRPASTSTARTVMRHQDGSLVAHVYLKPSLNAAELIAHEIEHILEQLDGVDLQAQAGNRLVWKADDGVFETRRAIEAGRRVAREITSGSNVTDVRHLPPENHADRRTTVVQHDRNATPSSGRSARVSGSGRYVVFVSSAQLVEADRNRFSDVYVLDLATGACSLESAGPGGTPGNGESLSPDISRDGRYVVFESASSNLLDTQVLPGIFRVFLRDREKGVTRLLSPNANGHPEHRASGNPAISADGTVVVFESTATDLVESGDTARSPVGIYLIRLTSGQRSRLDLTSAGGRPTRQSMSPAISADGRFVAFVSKADLTCGDASTCVTAPSDKKGVAAIYLRDTHTNTTTRVTRSYDGGDANGPSYHPAISGDGRHVAFVSEASNLARGSTSRTANIYVHDLDTGLTDLVSRTPGGRPANGPSLRPALSQDGATVAFQSLASDLVCEGKCRGGQPDINLVWDVFVYNRAARRTTRVSTDISEEWMENSRAPSLDDAGQVIAFGSRHPINGRDAARDEDLYVLVQQRPLQTWNCLKLLESLICPGAAANAQSRDQADPQRLPRGSSPARGSAAMSIPQR